MIQLQEHEQLCKNDLPVEKNERYDNLQLIQWDKPMDNSAWGYYASFKIGAEWIDKQEALVVTAKRGMEKIDFLRMFMTCFCSDLAVDSFSKIYSIDQEKGVYTVSIDTEDHTFMIKVSGSADVEEWNRFLSKD